MTLRYSTPWMQQLDERIVEYLREKSIADAEILAAEIETATSPVRVQERCRVLTRAGLIAPIAEDAEFYEITSLGVMYLKGRLVAEGLHRDAI